jgi:hypothetical protein
MPQAKNIAAFEDLRPHYNRALQSPNGIRIRCASSGAAVSMRARFYTLRKLEREASVDLFPPEHPLRGLSPYENLSISIEDNCVVIRHTEPIVVEDL